MIESQTLVSPADIANHYNELDELYFNSWGENLHHGLWDDPQMTKDEAVLNLTRTVARMAEIGAGDQVCDIGCGYGAASRFFASECQAHVTGLTLSKKQFDRNSAQTFPNVDIRLQDFLKNDLVNASFDQAVSIESSEHMPDKPRFFAEAHRILKTGGNFVICAWTASTDLSPWQKKHLIEPICREGRLPQMGTIEDYRNWLIQGGFQVNETLDVSKKVQKTWSVALADLSKYFFRNPGKLQLLLPKHNQESFFLKSLFRIPLAYQVGAMKYFLISATKL